MFGLNSEKVFNKIKFEVLPEIANQDVEDIVKYNLALNYMSKMNSYNQMGLLTGATIGTACFFAFTSPILVAAGATGAIASLIHVRKAFKDEAMCDKLFKLLILGLEIVHEATPKDVQQILDNITAEDLVEFLERKGLLAYDK